MKKTINFKALLIFVIGIFLLTFIDQITKIMAVGALKGKDPIVLIDNAFEFYYLQNTGTAWGMFGGAINIFLIITVVVFIVIFYVVSKIPADKKMIPFLITLTVLGAGAAGNFIDRLTLGYVRDFIYFKLINFPVFNVADIYVTLSMISFIIMILFIYKEEDFSFLNINKSERSDR